jgi:hypothetical protein
MLPRSYTVCATGYGALSPNVSRVSRARFGTTQPAQPRVRRRVSMSEVLYGPGGERDDLKPHLPSRPVWRSFACRLPGRSASSRFGDVESRWGVDACGSTQLRNRLGFCYIVSYMVGREFTVGTPGELCAAAMGRRTTAVMKYVGKAARGCCRRSNVPCAAPPRRDRMVAVAAADLVPLLRSAISRIQIDFAVEGST